eukprot:Lankesteria_metandrocarpae@DN9863_c0_g1_i1.p1
MNTDNTNIDDQNNYLVSCQNTNSNISNTNYKNNDKVGACVTDRRSSSQYLEQTCCSYTVVDVPNITTALRSADRRLHSVSNPRNVVVAKCDAHPVIGHVKRTAQDESALITAQSLEGTFITAQEESAVITAQSLE